VNVHLVLQAVSTNNQMLQ